MYVKMNSIIVILLFVGMFLIVQGVYEIRIKDLESARREIEEKLAKQAESILQQNDNPVMAIYDSQYAVFQS
jgi:hypothetical protein